MLRLLLALRGCSMSHRRGAKRSRGPRAAPTIVLDPDGTTKCQICHLDGSADHFCSACSHVFCMKCIGQHFRSSASKLQRISCPVDGCSHEASTYEVKKVLGEEAAEEYKTKLVLALEELYHETKQSQPAATRPPACKNCLSTSIVCVEQIPDMPHKEVQAVLQVKGLKKTRSKIHGVDSLINYLNRLSQRWTCTGCNYEENLKPGEEGGSSATKDAEEPTRSWESTDAYQLHTALVNLEGSWTLNSSCATKQNSSDTKQHTVWANGTGFGGSSVEGDFIKAARKTSAESFKAVDKVVASIMRSLQGTSSLAISAAAVLGAGSLEKILDHLLGSSLLDIHISKRETSYLGVFKLLTSMGSFPELRPKEAIVDKLEKLVEQANIGSRGGESSDTAFFQELTSCYDKLTSSPGQKRRNCRRADEIVEISARSMYVEKLKPMQFRLVSGDAPFPHYFRDTDKQADTGTNHKRMLRIQKEVASLAVSLPLMWESSIHVCINEDNMSFIKALIIGPQGTPYQNGVFLFDIYLPSAYPTSPPKVQFLTTGGGQVRFNPNLYATGYVCLSLLGTWSQGPSWLPGESTLLQVLVSIQSLIFVKDPFYNEPGHERYGRESAAADENRRHRAATLSVAILGALRKPDPVFQEVILDHFRWKKLEIEQQCDEWVKLDPSVSSTAHAVKEQLRAFNSTASTSKVTPTTASAPAPAPAPAPAYVLIH